MNQPNAHSLINVIFSLLIGISLTLLTGCQALPSKTNHQQDKKIYLLGLEQAISKGQWLINEYKYQIALQDSSEGTLLTPFNIRHYQFEQKVLSTRLIEYAQKALAKGDTKNASRCYQVLRKLQTPASLAPALSDIEKRLSARKEITLAKKQTKLGNKLDKSIEEGQLIESSQLISQLQHLKLLSKEVLVKIDKAKGILTHNAELLDEKADIFYRDGNIQLAKSLWEYLLKFDPENQSIKNKLARSDRVIKNMLELRDNDPQTPPETLPGIPSDNTSNNPSDNPSDIKNSAQRRILNR